jgi:non-ribosomal peptide synthetase component F
LDRWRERLEGVVSYRFPARSNAVDTVDPSLGAIYAFSAPPSADQPLSRRIADFAREERVSPSSVFLAAFLAYLALVTGQNDIALPTYSHGRSNVRLRQVVGFFLSVIILRLEVSSGQTFRQLVNAAFRSLIQGLKDQDVPFDGLLSHIPDVAAALANPEQMIVVFQTLASPTRLSPDFGDALRGDRCDAGEQDASVGTTPHDLLWTIIPQDAGSTGELRGLVRFRLSRFERDEIIRHVEAYLAFLVEALQHPDTSLASLSKAIP